MSRREKEITGYEEIKYILDNGRVVHLGLSDDGIPYVVPMNYGYCFENEKPVLFVHGALKGRKLDIIRKNPACCAQIECDVSLFSGKVACLYGCTYCSFTGFGKAKILDAPDEKMKALSLLMKTQSGKDFEFNEKLVSVVSVIRIDIEEYSAKYRPVPEDREIIG